MGKTKPKEQTIQPSLVDYHKSMEKYWQDVAFQHSKRATSDTFRSELENQIAAAKVAWHHGEAYTHLEKSIRYVEKAKEAAQEYERRLKEKDEHKT